MESTPTLFKSLPKRQQNAARKRVGLLDALLTRLATRSMPAITVRELCDEVGVAEQTFFNTFGGKPAVLSFHVMLWSIEMQWRMQRADTAEQALRSVFVQSALQMTSAPCLMPEIIVHQIRGRADGLPVCAPPTRGDKLLRFSEMPGAVELEAQPIQLLLGGGVELAVTNGELPANTDQEQLTHLLCALFFGAAASSSDCGTVADVLMRGFDALWRAHSHIDKANQ